MAVALQQSHICFAVLHLSRHHQALPLLAGLATSGPCSAVCSEAPHQIEICNRREDARFLYKRFPADIRIDPEVSASFQLLQRLWNKDYQVNVCVALHST